MATHNINNAVLEVTEYMVGFVIEDDYERSDEHQELLDGQSAARALSGMDAHSQNSGVEIYNVSGIRGQLCYHSVAGPQDGQQAHFRALIGYAGFGLSAKKADAVAWLDQHAPGKPCIRADIRSHYAYVEFVAEEDFQFWAGLLNIAGGVATVKTDAV